MAPALSEASRLRQHNPGVGSEQQLLHKSLQVVPVSLTANLVSVPSSPPVAASPPPSTPSPPTSACGVTTTKNHHHHARRPSKIGYPGEDFLRSSNDLISTANLDSCFDTPAPADTPPHHCLSPLSPPLSPSPGTDCDDEDLDDLRSKGISDIGARLFHVRKPVATHHHHSTAPLNNNNPHTYDNNMDSFVNLDCHLPDSPSSQLSLAATVDHHQGQPGSNESVASNEPSSGDGEPVDYCDNANNDGQQPEEAPPAAVVVPERTPAFDFDNLISPNVSWTQPPALQPVQGVDVAGVVSRALTRAKSKQVDIVKKHALLLLRVRRLSTAAVYKAAVKAAQRVTLVEKDASDRHRTTTVEESLACSLKTELALRADEPAGELVKKLEEKYESNSSGLGSRYTNRLQSVTFIREKSAVKRKPSPASNRLAVAVTTGSGKRSKLVELDAAGKEELRAHFGQLHAEWRCLARKDAVTSLVDDEDADAGFEDSVDDGDATESSSGGESGDEGEGFSSRSRGVGASGSDRQSKAPSM